MSSIEIPGCRDALTEWSASELRTRGRSNLDLIVFTMSTDDAVEGTSFRFAALGAGRAGHVAQGVPKSFFVGKDPMGREKYWQEFRMHDRWSEHVPMYAYGPFDACLWDLAGKVAGLRLYREFRDAVPVYASSLVMPTPEDSARQAMEAKNRN